MYDFAALKKAEMEFQSARKELAKEYFKSVLPKSIPIEEVFVDFYNTENAEGYKLGILLFRYKGVAYRLQVNTFFDFDSSENIITLELKNLDSGETRRCDESDLSVTLEEI